MTETKHTPGPWKIVRNMGFGVEGVKETDDPECQMGFAGPNGERVCWFGQSADYYPTEGDEPSEADARIMVAAPDLLAELKRTRDDLMNVKAFCPFAATREAISRMIRRIDTAIAKAEGRA